MKQVYKKKPEYLDVVFVADDTTSIKEVYELAGVDNASIKFPSMTLCSRRRNPVSWWLCHRRNSSSTMMCTMKKYLTQKKESKL